MKSVLLVSLPSLSPRYPSLALGVLKNALRRRGIPVIARQFHVYFGAWAGWAMAEALAMGWNAQVGEWVFSEAAFGPGDNDPEYLRQNESAVQKICRMAGCDAGRLLKIRREAAPAYLRGCLDVVDWDEIGLAGFSCVVQQNVASLALGRMLRERRPDIPQVYGGPGVDGEIGLELLRGSPWMDFVFQGEGDEHFPELARRVLEGFPAEGVPGVAGRGGDGAALYFTGRAPRVGEMDSVPFPDHSDYFDAARDSGWEKHFGRRNILLPVETSRGCWWGEHRHCTFCGNNSLGMTYRARTASNALQMFEQMYRQHGIGHFTAADSILDPGYVESVFGELGRRRCAFRFHWCIRPTLTRRQIRTLREGGVYSVQPGIESLSTPMLRSMRKGMAAIRNIECLKWCRYYRMECLWNMLMGFPGETEEDYRKLSELIPWIVHLQPPTFLSRARVDRGSPWFLDPGAHAVRSIRPFPCYAHIYPPDRYDLRKVSHFFEAERDGCLEMEGYQPFIDAVELWKTKWAGGAPPFLAYTRSRDGISVRDTRGDRPAVFELEGRLADLLESIAESRTLEQARKEFGERGQPDDGWIAGGLDLLVRHRLAVHMDRRFLGLALPANPDH